MLAWALVFAVLAVAAGYLGFVALAGVASQRMVVSIELAAMTSNVGRPILEMAKEKKTQKLPWVRKPLSWRQVRWRSHDVCAFAQTGRAPRRSMPWTV